MAYTAFDRFVAWCRFRAALPYVRPQTQVCDIGCGLDARFLHHARSKVTFGVGIDDQVRPCSDRTLVRGNISQGLPFRTGSFDHATLLAVLEHLPEPKPVLAEIYRVLKPGGSVIMTWPAGVIDPLLHVLHRVGLVSHEMESEEHQARMPLTSLVSALGAIGFVDFKHRTFELGLNNLLVCYKPEVERS